NFSFTIDDDEEEEHADDAEIDPREIAARLRRIAFEALPHVYRQAVDNVHLKTKNGHAAGECLQKLDLFHAAFIGEWFFLRFGIVEQSLSDADYAEVEQLADAVFEVDPTGLALRLPLALRRLARIVEGYGPVLTSLEVSRQTSRAYHLKARRLRG